MLFTQGSPNPLASDLTHTRLRLAAGAVPVIRVGVRDQDREKVSQALGNEAARFHLGAGNEKLEFTPLRPLSADGELRGLVAGPKLLAWFDQDAKPKTPAPLLVYQRREDERAHLFLTRVLGGHLHQPPPRFRDQLVGGLPPFCALSCPRELDNWQFLQTVVATLSKMLPRSWGWTVFDTALPIHLLTESPGTDLDGPEWELQRDHPSSRYMGEGAAAPTLLRTYPVDGPQQAISLLQNAAGKGEWGQPAEILPVPGCYHFAKRRVYCVAVEWAFDFHGQDPHVEATCELAHSPPLPPQAPGARRVQCFFGAWKGDGSRVEVSPADGWELVGEEALTVDLLGPTVLRSGLSGFYFKFRARDPLELLLVPGDSPAVLGGRQTHNPELEKKYDLALHAESVAVGEKVWLQSKVDVAGSFDVVAHPGAQIPGSLVPGAARAEGAPEESAPQKSDNSKPDSAAEAEPDWKVAIIKTVDGDPVTRGAGIALIDAGGTPLELRGGKLDKWVFIVVERRPLLAPTSPTAPTFWDRWGSVVLNCGSAGAAGVVIGLSGGTVSLVAGAFALNSTALCGLSIAKGLRYDAWQEFEKYGGGAYKAWLTAETLMSLADLCDGMIGAVGLLKKWEKAGKLAKLEKAVEGQNLKRSQLLKRLRDVDPKVDVNLKAKGPSYISKKKLIEVGEGLLEENHFKSLSNQQAQTIWSGIGNAFTLAGAPETWKSVQKTYGLYFIQLKDNPSTE